MDYLKDITDKIREGKCVLIIGPDIIDFGEKTFFEAMCESFASTAEYKSIIDSSPQYIFANEELFQPISERYETDLQNMMKDFYDNQSAFDEPLQQVSQIPFHLIISLMPDDRIRKLFTRQNMDFNYGHYPREGAAAPSVEKPSKEKPLIYNLLGDFNRTESIITFDDLFDFLSDIMGRKELPTEIQVTLKEAALFLFLGVNFEKWYAQLLLRIITPKRDRKNKYTLLRKEGNNDVCTFIARRLNLKLFTTAPKDFLNDLFEECKSQDLLKTIRGHKKKRVFISYSHNDKETASAIKKHLLENDIEVRIDDTSMKGGQKIEDFITSIKDVDVVIPILSNSSLLSPWVSKEIITTIDKTNKHLLPCYIDKTFQDKNFLTIAKPITTDKVKQINDLINQRGIESTEDLDNQKKLWIDYYQHLPKVLNELNNRKCISLMDSDFAMSLENIVKDINQLEKPE